MASTSDKIVLASGGIRRVKMKSGSYGYTSNRGLLKESTVRRLQNQGLIKQRGDSFSVTSSGKRESAGTKPENLRSTTPSGAVAAAQREKAVSASPLKKTATKKPPSKKNQASPSTRQFQVEVTDTRGRKTLFEPLPGGTSDTAFGEARKEHPDAVKFTTSRKDLTQKKSNKVKGKFITDKSGNVKKVRTGLSMDPKQVARRAKRGFPNGR